MKKYVLLGLLLTSSMAFANDNAHFEQGSEKDIIYRKNIFGSIKSYTQNISMILKSEAGDADHLAQLAHALSLNAKMIEDAFKKDTRHLDADSKAKNEIWENFEGFQSEITKFSDATDLFYKKTQENKEISLKDFKSVVGSCKSCHQSFKD